MVFVVLVGDGDGGAAQRGPAPIHTHTHPQALRRRAENAVQIKHSQQRDETRARTFPLRHALRALMHTALRIARCVRDEYALSLSSPTHVTHARAYTPLHSLLAKRQAKGDSFRNGTTGTNVA